MRRLYVLILAFLVLTSPVIFLNYKKGNTESGKVTLLKGSFNLEDSIIIRDLKMETDNPPADELPDNEGDGQIIYDDSFDDDIVDIDTIGKTESVKSVKAKRNASLSKLRKKDSRWHLTRYRIRKNDNLWIIAKRFGISHRLIIRINVINNPDMLLPGKYIDIPSRNGLYYTVKSGDTLGVIANRYRTGVENIIHHNRLNGKLIKTGEKLFIPGAHEKQKRIKKKGADKVLTARPSGIRFKWPLRGKLTSGFGTRKDPFSNKKQFHCGIDISADIGEKIRASADGRVIFSGWKYGYGKVVIIRHNMGYITVYAHNSKNIIPEGRKVKSGEVIALTGNTGAVTGAHLHFEIRKYVTPLNPLRMLK